MLLSFPRQGSSESLKMAERASNVWEQIEAIITCNIQARICELSILPYI